MRVRLTVIEGPHLGNEFVYEEHASFVVGRHRRTQFQLPLRDPYLSRFHFYVEVNPPRCSLVDLGSSNHTYVNGRKAGRVALADDDVIKAGKTKLRVSIEEEAGSATASPPLDRYAIPEVPHYRIERLIGAGASGAVYLATDERDEARIALKVLSPVIAECPRSNALFEREAAILRTLDHPHVVRLYEAGRAGRRLFMAMEYVPGPDALHLVESSATPLPIGRAIAMIRQTLTALDHAHAARIVHRDVKPNNLLVARIGGRDVVKLGDFGLARIYHDSSLSGLTVDGDVRGTFGFLAPEHISDLRSVGPPADQYGVAATLYFLLTERTPYEFPVSIQDCLLMILQDDALPVRRFRPDVPKPLADVIHRALARDPEDRFESVAAMREALAPWDGAT